MKMPENQQETASRTAVANYVASIAADLATLARRNGLDTLGYLLDMARLEAETARGGRAANGRRS
jgi:hypothetical protein